MLACLRIDSMACPIDEWYALSGDMILRRTYLPAPGERKSYIRAIYG